MKNLSQAALQLHERLKGKIETKPKIKVDQKSLALLYTPGVAEVVLQINKEKEDVYKYTAKGNTIAIISDGSRVLGLGNQGAEAAIPVMEGKALIYKAFGNVNAIPLCLKTQDKEEIISIVENLAPNFGAINIEDIEAPKCFEIVDELTRRLDIPIFHDDQQGTAVVAVAGLLNALKVVNKYLKTVKIVIFGAGAAGYGITRLLVHAGATNIRVLDSKGIIYQGRKDLNKYKEELASMTNKQKENGNLMDALKNADVFIGVSGQTNVLTCKNVATMKERAIIFALSNPDAEMSIEEATQGCAAVVATGRSDFKNQVNNSVCFPFIMKKILEERIKKIDQDLLLSVAKKIAAKVKHPTKDKIIPKVEEVKSL
ncbi:NADP-dependent malic enzyme [Candidatus Woesearchaeota archaeon]|nr:NADP-dependent malic enzyme [Candidatus Woesearchaeota archaeon]